jgi:hypothetical protein
MNALSAIPVLLFAWSADVAALLPSTRGEPDATTITFGTDAHPGWLVTFDGELTWEDVAPQLDKRFKRQPLQGRIAIGAEENVAVYMQNPEGRADERSIDLSPLDALEPDQLYLLHIQTSTISADELKQLRKHKGLRHLSVGPLKELTNADLAPLKEMRWIEYLSLTGPAVTDKRLTILQELPQLKKGGRGLRLLQLNGKEVTDDTLLKLAGHTGLEILDLTGAAVTDDGLKHLEPLTRLKHLKLGATPITGKGLWHLRGAEGLEELALSRSAITDDGLVAVENFENLRTLRLMHTAITDAGLAHLSTLTNLQKLQLDETSINGDGFAQLKNLDRLRELYLMGAPVADPGLKHLSELDSLELLWLYGTNVTDDGLKYLADIPNLKHVSVTGTQVTEEAVERFRKQRPDLRVTHEPVPVPLVQRRQPRENRLVVDHSSPQSVFDAYQQAIDRQNWTQLYATLSPASRERMLGVLFYSLTMAAANRNLKSEVDAVLKEHRIDFAKAGREVAGVSEADKSQTAIDAVLRQVDDKTAFFSDLVQFSIRHDPSGEGEPFTRFEDGSLRDVSIEGDEAEGSVTVRRKKEQAPGRSQAPARGQASGPVRGAAEPSILLRFRRVEGRWYIAREDPAGEPDGREPRPAGGQPRERQAPAPPTQETAPAPVPPRPHRSSR